VTIIAGIQLARDGPSKQTIDLLAVISPITTGLIWASCEVASRFIESEIYKFRTRTGIIRRKNKYNDDWTITKRIIF
jgi:hypothetical protein